MKRFSTLLFLLASACATVPPVTDDALIIEGGFIYGHGDGSIVIANGRIVHAGDADTGRRLAPRAKRIDARGMTILPGLVDAHAHLGGLGESFDTVNLVGTSSIRDVQQRVAERAATLAPGEWLKGRGWDQNDWPEKRFPTAADLDAVVGDRPVWLSRVDGHASWANTRAMELAGITAATRDPDGGKIVRDSKGNPTGIFIDTAESLVDRVIPPYSKQRRREQFEAAMKDAARHGLTGVHDAGVGASDIEVLRQLADEGKMPIRVYAMLADNETLFNEWFPKGPLQQGNLTVRSVKLYADGALGSRGAALIEPYSDDPSNSGLLITSAERIAGIARRARAAGFQVNTHAIGDRAVRAALDGYAAAGVTANERFRIEHFQVAHPDDIRRTGTMGVIASMQPTHATSDMYWAEQRVGPERIKGAYAWRSVLDAGGRLAFGSDFPVEAVNPFLGLHAAVTRQDVKRWPAGGWQPHEKVTLDEAIAGFTAGAAYASFQENDLGTIAKGKLGDLTIIEGTLDPADLDKTRVRYTIVGGRVVYSAD